MDKIIIRDLEVYAYHGVNPEEKKLGQMFVVSVEMGVNLEPAGYVDDLDCTIDYGLICDDVKAAITETKHDLIEAAAISVIERLFLNHAALQSVKVTLKKPWAPLGHHLKYVAVEIEKSRLSEPTERFL